MQPTYAIEREDTNPHGYAGGSWRVVNRHTGKLIVNLMDYFAGGEPQAKAQAKRECDDLNAHERQARNEKAKAKRSAHNAVAALRDLSDHYRAEWLQWVFSQYVQHSQAKHYMGHHRPARLYQERAALKDLIGDVFAALTRLCDEQAAAVIDIDPAIAHRWSADAERLERLSREHAA